MKKQSQVSINIAIYSNDKEKWMKEVLSTVKKQSGACFTELWYIESTAEKNNIGLLWNNME